MPPPGTSWADWPLQQRQADSDIDVLFMTRWRNRDESNRNRQHPGLELEGLRDISIPSQWEEMTAVGRRQLWIPPWATHLLIRLRVAIYLKEIYSTEILGAQLAGTGEIRPRFGTAVGPSMRVHLSCAPAPLVPGPNPEDPPTTTCPGPGFGADSTPEGGDGQPFEKESLFLIPSGLRGTEQDFYLEALGDANCDSVEALPSTGRWCLIGG